MMLTFGSLFAGIGGIDAGLERAGMQCRWQVEIDPWCRRVLAKHWPDVLRYGDIRECGAHNLEPVDLLCGGFPCVDISNAGAKAGLDGEHSGLWREMARIAGELRPHYILVENVADLLGRGMGRVLGDLAELGYDAEWSVVSACALGAPHTRERLFVLAYPNGQLQPSWLGSITDGAPAVFPTGDAERAECWLEPFSGVRGVANGVPSRVDRLRGLGNSVAVPVVEWIGRRIVATT